MNEMLSGSFNDIINNLLNFLYFLMDFLFGWINLPQVPNDLINSINSFFSMVFDNLSLLSFFIRPTTLKILIDLMIFLIGFKYSYKIIMWLIKKIPFLDLG